MHVCPGRLIVDLGLDVSDLVSVKVILPLIPALLQKPVVGGRSRLVGAVHFLQLKTFLQNFMFSKTVLETT